MLLLALGFASPLAAQDLLGDDEESTEGEGDEEEWEEPDPWERPPVEQEKPQAPPPKKVEEPVGDGRRIDAGLLLGWGFQTDRSTGGLGADPYGLAIGARGGYTLDFQLYVGAFFVYYLGSTDSGGGRTTVVAETSANYMQFGAEAGYDLWFGDLLFRPGAQIGAALAVYDVNEGGVKESGTVGDFMIAPGFLLMKPFDDFFLGGDLRANLVSGDGVSAVSLFVNGGMRFE
jgi:hypothetical protein